MYMSKLRMPPFCLLPLELLLEIFMYLDYRSLIDMRLTCKWFHNAMDSQHFWRTLASDVQTGLAPVAQLDGYSSEELMRWTLRSLRARACLNSSGPLRFRSRVIASKVARANKAELLPGGRWFFSVHDNGSAFIVDLDQEQPQPQLLFTNTSSIGRPLGESCTWIDGGSLPLSFRVAVYSWEMEVNRKTRICIYRVDNAGEDPNTPFVATRLSVIWENPRRAKRYASALSAKYFVHYIMQDGNEEEDYVGELRLYRYSRKTDALASAVSEKLIAPTWPCQLFFLPGERIGFITRNFINVFSIKYNVDTAALSLVSIHHVLHPQDPEHFSPPFIRTTQTHLMSIYEENLRRITIDHDATLPPVVEEAEKVIPNQNIPDKVWFGPTACILLRRPFNKPVFDVATYEFHAPPGAARISCREHFQSYDPPNSQPKGILAFDETIGRIVFLGRSGGGNRVMDLI
ncbi:hypothetical protein P691DRAFT_376368 [Macrolepiota fuliginosa MF-IS2]|uniref:F-box domain-containing protein n=1 Tax=Macrolepiota fuliginosa MF-IS2 TaxID=1400762 RepID=A0A9P5X3V4_9AGAR|nr:hypothetical protein P691DRAFT_376368 [Macrolepiota fuliginosa MF-IS2]